MSEPLSFLDGKVTLHAGDCLDVIKTLADNSIESVVTDPPYALVSIVKRFGKTAASDDTQTSERTRAGADGYARLAKGFMGKEWDNGAVAFAVEFWAQVLRVVKPGGHVAAFSGTRSYHRLACAIEDAGFEIRDQLAWTYGSGFPKSLDVSKAIDKAAGIAFDARPASGVGFMGPDGPGGYNVTINQLSRVGDSTAEAIEWQGWGTALKPAWEPICLARKPLSEKTVAGNVLKWSTGAINIDACRIETAETWRGRELPNAEDGVTWGGTLNASSSSSSHPLGRWPANVMSDGSPEVLAAFPDSDSSRSEVTSKPGSVYGNGAGLPPHTGIYGFDDSGSAARFFYSAKADADDRLGSKHPTVKPVDLMQWLCRLITPPGGTVLDCFAGTGTTGAAAYREGFRAVLIEREPEYQQDIARRMKLELAGPDERARESIKAKLGDKPQDHGPLFGGLPESPGGACEIRRPQEQVLRRTGRAIGPIGMRK